MKRKICLTAQPLNSTSFSSFLCLVRKLMRWVPDSSYKIWICESVEDIVRFVLREVFPLGSMNRPVNLIAICLFDNKIAETNAA